MLQMPRLGELPTTRPTDTRQTTDDSMLDADLLRCLNNISSGAELTFHVLLSFDAFASAVVRKDEDAVSAVECGFEAFNVVDICCCDAETRVEGLALGKELLR